MKGACPIADFCKKYGYVVCSDSPTEPNRKNIHPKTRWMSVCAEDQIFALFGTTMGSFAFPFRRV